MNSRRTDAVETLLKSYAAYFNINRFDDDKNSLLVARCDFFEHSQKYVLSRKAELWSTDSEEFLYLFNVPKLDLETLNACQKTAYEDGMSRLNIGPGHMYSFITAVFLCDFCAEDARKALKKTRIYKSFHFSLHGWMDYHTVAVSFDDNKINSNYSGRSTAKIMKKILFNKKEKEK